MVRPTGLEPVTPGLEGWSYPVNQRPTFSSSQRQYFPYSLIEAALLHSGNDPHYKSLILRKLENSRR